MRSLLLLSVLLGVALAKSKQEELKKLTSLLKKVLAEKDEGDFGSGGSGSWPPPGMGIETTLFEGLGEYNVPFKLFGGIIDIDFTQPLEIAAGDKENYMQEVRQAANSISDVGRQIVDALHAFAAENADKSPSLDEIASFASNSIEPIFYENPQADLEPHMTGTMFALMQGAVGGTQGASREEPGCDFDGDESELLNCVMNKMFLVTWASEVAVEEAQFMLEADFDGSGRFLQPCDQLFNYLWASDCHKPEPAAVLGAFKASMKCLVKNIELIRDRIGMRAPEEFPGEQESRLPLPLLIKSQAFMQHIGAQAYWAMESVYTVMFLNYNDGEDDGYDKKALAHKKLAARHKFLSRTAKAYARKNFHKN